MACRYTSPTEPVVHLGPTALDKATIKTDPVWIDVADQFLELKGILNFIKLAMDEFDTSNDDVDMIADRLLVRFHEDYRAGEPIVKVRFTMEENPDRIDDASDYRRITRQNTLDTLFSHALSVFASPNQRPPVMHLNTQAQRNQSQSDLLNQYMQRVLERVTAGNQQRTVPVEVDLDEVRQILDTVLGTLLFSYLFNPWPLSRARAESPQQIVQQSIDVIDNLFGRLAKVQWYGLLDQATQEVKVGDAAYQQVWVQVYDPVTAGPLILAMRRSFLDVAQSNLLRDHLTRGRNNLTELFHYLYPRALGLSLLGAKFASVLNLNWAAIRRQLTRDTVDDTVLDTEGQTMAQFLLQQDLEALFRVVPRGNKPTQHEVDTLVATLTADFTRLAETQPRGAEHRLVVRVSDAVTSVARILTVYGQTGTLNYDQQEDLESAFDEAKNTTNAALSAFMEEKQNATARKRAELNGYIEFLRDLYLRIVEWELTVGRGLRMDNEARTVLTRLSIQRWREAAGIYLREATLFRNHRRHFEELQTGQGAATLNHLPGDTLIPIHMGKPVEVRVDRAIVPDAGMYQFAVFATEAEARAWQTGNGNGPAANVHGRWYVRVLEECRRCGHAFDTSRNTYGQCAFAPQFTREEEYVLRMANAPNPSVTPQRELLFRLVEQKALTLEAPVRFQLQGIVPGLRQREDKVQAWDHVPDALRDALRQDVHVANSPVATIARLSKRFPAFVRGVTPDDIFFWNVMSDRELENDALVKRGVGTADGLKEVQKKYPDKDHSDFKRLAKSLMEEHGNHGVHLPRGDYAVVNSETDTWKPKDDPRPLRIFRDFHSSISNQPTRPVRWLSYTRPSERPDMIKLLDTYFIFPNELRPTQAYTTGEKVLFYLTQTGTQNAMVNALKELPEKPHWQGLTYELLGAARARTVIRYFRGRDDAYLSLRYLPFPNNEVELKRLKREVRERVAADMDAEQARDRTIVVPENPDVDLERLLGAQEAVEYRLRGVQDLIGDLLRVAAADRSAADERRLAELEEEFEELNEERRQLTRPTEALETVFHELDNQKLARREGREDRAAETVNQLIDALRPRREIFVTRLNAMDQTARQRRIDDIHMVLNTLLRQFIQLTRVAMPLDTEEDRQLVLAREESISALVDLENEPLSDDPDNLWDQLLRRLFRFVVVRAAIRRLLVENADADALVTLIEDNIDLLQAFTELPTDVGIPVIQGLKDDARPLAIREWNSTPPEQWVTEGEAEDSLRAEFTDYLVPQFIQRWRSVIRDGDDLKQWTGAHAVVITEDVRGGRPAYYSLFLSLFKVLQQTDYEPAEQVAAREVNLGGNTVLRIWNNAINNLTHAPILAAESAEIDASELLQFIHNMQRTAFASSYYDTEDLVAVGLFYRGIVNDEFPTDANDIIQGALDRWAAQQPEPTRLTDVFVPLGLPENQVLLIRKLEEEKRIKARNVLLRRFAQGAQKIFAILRRIFMLKQSGAELEVGDYIALFWQLRATLLWYWIYPLDTLYHESFLLMYPDRDAERQRALFLSSLGFTVQNDEYHTYWLAQWEPRYILDTTPAFVNVFLVGENLARMGQRFLEYRGPAILTQETVMDALKALHDFVTAENEDVWVTVDLRQADTRDDLLDTETTKYVYPWATYEVQRVRYDTELRVRVIGATVPSFVHRQVPVSSHATIRSFSMTPADHHATFGKLFNRPVDDVYPSMAKPLEAVPLRVQEVPVISAAATPIAAALAETNADKVRALEWSLYKWNVDGLARDFANKQATVSKTLDPAYSDGIFTASRAFNLKQAEAGPAARHKHFDAAQKLRQTDLPKQPKDMYTLENNVLAYERRLLEQREFMNPTKLETKLVAFEQETVLPADIRADLMRHVTHVSLRLEQELAQTQAYKERVQTHMKSL